MEIRGVLGRLRGPRVCQSADRRTLVGADELLSEFTSAGLDGRVSIWVEVRDNEMPLPDDVEQKLHPSEVDRTVAQADLTRNEVKNSSACTLPGLLDKLPHAESPPTGDLQAVMKNFDFTLKSQSMIAAR
ncbi:MAG: YidB family protein [Ilumatobacter sp.]|nr:YidB family protein [Ilumatobacter sp.]MDG1696128.1 YidB family protein [Ilumatobacter sp.]MDG2439678.1 YidB family protein [Ilumatobacter sp.]